MPRYRVVARYAFSEITVHASDTDAALEIAVDVARESAENLANYTVTEIEFGDDRD